MRSLNRSDTLNPVVTPDNERWAIFEDQVLASGFTQIPNLVILNPRLSMQAKYLYGLLLSYAWKDPFSFPGQKRLCKLCNVKKADTLRPYLQELHDSGVMTIVRRGQGKTNLYRFNALVASEDNSNAETRSSGYQETRQEGYPETRSTGRKEYEGEEYSSNNTKSSGKGKIKGKELDEVAGKWDALIENSLFGDSLKAMAEIMAESNTTGVVAVTRAWRELGEPFLKYYEDEKLGDEAWKHGFDVALNNGVHNIRYARNTARNYNPNKKRRKNGANGPHQQRGRSRREEFEAEFGPDR